MFWEPSCGMDCCATVLLQHNCVARHAVPNMSQGEKAIAAGDMAGPVLIKAGSRSGTSVLRGLACMVFLNDAMVELRDR